MARYQKYFLALVPEGKLQDQVTELKLLLKEEFNIKYALKSPAHITVKMPFSYNEQKENVLIGRLKDFVQNYDTMEMVIGGVKTFGDRVVYLNVEAGKDLYHFQSELKTFCKRELKLVDELSDRNYHPHMTVAFKDLKKHPIPNIIKVLESKPISEKFVVNHLFLLIRQNGRWEICSKMEFRG